MRRGLGSRDEISLNCAGSCFPSTEGESPAASVRRCTLPAGKWHGLSCAGSWARGGGRRFISATLGSGFFCCCAWLTFLLVSIAELGRTEHEGAGSRSQPERSLKLTRVVVVLRGDNYTPALARLEPRGRLIPREIPAVPGVSRPLISSPPRCRLLGGDLCCESLLPFPPPRSCKAA